MTFFSNTLPNRKNVDRLNIGAYINPPPTWLKNRFNLTCRVKFVPAGQNGARPLPHFFGPYA